MWIIVFTADARIKSTPGDEKLRPLSLVKTHQLHQNVLTINNDKFSDTDGDRSWCLKTFLFALLLIMPRLVPINGNGMNKIQAYILI
jgi:hypothetical protein